MEEVFGITTPLATSIFAGRLDFPLAGSTGGSLEALADLRGLPGPLRSVIVEVLGFDANTQSVLW